jgi:acetoacetyl-CoA synthetase
MTRFLRDVNTRHGLRLASYRQLWEWSVAHIPEFWTMMWDFAGIIASTPYDRIVDDLSRFPGARWFAGARLNFAQNLLGRGAPDQEALVFRDETEQRSAVTYAELRDTVARLAAALRAEGVRPGDRVAAYMPNLIETVTAMLAATSIGAIWASCAADIAPDAAVDRLGQIGPAVLFTADGYVYKGRPFDTLAGASRVVAGIPTLRRVVVISHLRGRRDADTAVHLGGIPRAVGFDEFLSGGRRAHGGSAPAPFEQLPADHPVFIMFSSGTTGRPKCLVQGAGGVLINHVKELLLHSDLHAGERIAYITTCSWMMWNWLVSALAVGATIVLYDGNPTHPDPGAMWKLAQDERVAVFGCSASYLTFLSSRGIRPRAAYDLSSLKEISQTGSPLSADGFEYVYREIKDDLHFNSISGGTDINGCFAAGNPLSPVYAGELQGPALAMKVAAYDDDAMPVFDRSGELVCEAPSPSMPLYFWDDPGGRKYHEAYFAHYPGRNVWRHGDYVTLHRDTGGMTFHGRSDTVLKPSGVRIGTAEIYHVVERIEEVADSLAVGQNWQGDQRIVLFVKLADGAVLTEALKERIRKALRERASPRHVPAVILEAPDIPYTLNMKKVESAVMNIANGRPVANKDALVNPESLGYFERALAEISSTADDRTSGGKR